MRLPRYRRRLVVRAAPIAFGLLSCAALAADEPWRVWSSVQRFSGEATIQASSWIDRDDGFAKETSRGEDRATISFVLERAPGGYGHDTLWRPVSIQITGESHLTRSSASQTHRIDYAAHGSFDLALPTSANLSLTLIHETGEWELLLPSSLGPSVPLAVERSEWRLGEDTVTENRTDSLTSLATMNFRGRAPHELGILTQSDSQHYEDPEEEERGGGHITVGHAVLWPEYDDFELRVRIADYDRWRPFGSIKAPKQPGNHLVARATLVAKKPGTAKIPEVSQFRFELVDTSREPGVCMNFPLHAKDSDPDLRLAAATATPGAVGAEGQALEVERSLRDADGRPYAEARVDSYDYGGRAQLQVTAELADGRVFVGRLEGAIASGSASIRIPKRTHSQWIADAWHEEHQTQGLGDYDDSENEPIHDGHKGDGFTYYEEYRGFAENGEWIYTSPRHRDMFIYQDSGTAGSHSIGDRFQGGIDLFSKLAGITTHEKLRDEEYDWKVRVMNENRRAAPHIVKQHGVSLTFTSSQWDANSMFVKGTTKGRLRKTQFVELSILGPEMDLGGTRVPLSDRLRARDRAVAHELLHTIGVEHHGTGAHGVAFYVRPPDHPHNPTGRAAFVSHSGGKPRVIRLLHEKTGQDMIETVRSVEERDALADLVRSQYEPYANHWGAIVTVEQQQKEFDDWKRDGLYKEDYLAGQYADEHSGDDQCVMRYTYAQIYQATGDRNLFYYVPPDSEPAGLQLCRSPEGTGVNLLGRKPQSRYGQTGPGLGNCFHQICVSDRYH